MLFNTYSIFNKLKFQLCKYYFQLSFKLVSTDEGVLEGWPAPPPAPSPVCLARASPSPSHPLPRQRLDLRPKRASPVRHLPLQGVDLLKADDDRSPSRVKPRFRSDTGREGRRSPVQRLPARSSGNQVLVHSSSTRLCRNTVKSISYKLL